MKKIFLLILVMSIISANLISCGGNSPDSSTGNTTAADSSADADNNDGDAAAGESESEELSDNLGDDHDFGGYRFRIMNYSPDTMTWLTPTITAEEETGETVNDAMYKRTTRVEERLNVDIDEIIVTNNLQTARTSVQAGTDDYDMIMLIDRDALSLALEGYTYSMNDLPYVDLSKPWWDQGANKALSIGNKLFFTYGDFNLTGYDMTCLLMFNKQLVQDLALADPYAMVKDGTWTFDKFFEMMQNVPQDLDGDGTITIDDRFGIMSIDSEYWPCFWLAAGENTIKKDADDIPYFAAGGNARFIDIMTKVFDLSTPEIYVDIRQKGTGFSEKMAADLFANQHALFYGAIVKKISFCRSMEVDFGLLPYPKADENQKEYYSRCEGGNVSVIPLTNTDLERTSIIMEVLAYESYKTVLPAYYDIALKGKYSRDEASEEMLDLIFNTRTIDMGDTYWAIQIREAFSAGALAKGNSNLVSVTEQISGQINSILQTSIESFNALK